MSGLKDLFCKEIRIIKVFHVRIYGLFEWKNGNFNMFTFVLLGNCAELNDNLVDKETS